jgi:hypothetical protein
LGNPRIKSSELNLASKSKLKDPVSYATFKAQRRIRPPNIEKSQKSEKNQLLTDTSSKHLVVRILTNLLNSSINALKMRRHVDLSVEVVCSIEVRRFVETAIHVTFVDHRPIKVE